MMHVITLNYELVFNSFFIKNEKISEMILVEVIKIKLLNNKFYVYF